VNLPQGSLSLRRRAAGSERMQERRENVYASSADQASGESRTATSRLAALFGRMVSSVTARRRERCLRLCEMLPLGEKRFVAVIEYGPRKFLLAGTPHTISLLRYLDANSESPDEPPRQRTNPEQE